MAILTLGDRFFGAILGVQTARSLTDALPSINVISSSTLVVDEVAQKDRASPKVASEADSEADSAGTGLESGFPRVAEMLLTYDPFTATATPSPAPSAALSNWIVWVLHRQLHGQALSSRFEELPGSLQQPWDSLSEGQSWCWSFRLLIQSQIQSQTESQTQSQPENAPPQPSPSLIADGLSLPEAAFVLGLWFGAGRGPQAIPLNSLSSHSIAKAQQRANQLYLTWAGHHEFGKVSVS